MCHSFLQWRPKNGQFTPFSGTRNEINLRLTRKVRTISRISSLDAVPHFPDAILVSQSFANFFVNEARKSNHTFKNAQTLKQSLIFNHCPRALEYVLCVWRSHFFLATAHRFTSFKSFYISYILWRQGLIDNKINLFFDPRVFFLSATLKKFRRERRQECCPNRARIKIVLVNEDLQMKMSLISEIARIQNHSNKGLGCQKLRDDLKCGPKQIVDRFIGELSEGTNVLLRGDDESGTTLFIDPGVVHCTRADAM